MGTSRSVWVHFKKPQKQRNKTQNIYILTVTVQNDNKYGAKQQILNCAIDTQMIERCNYVSLVIEEIIKGY